MIFVNVKVMASLMLGWATADIPVLVRFFWERMEIRSQNLIFTLTDILDIPRTASYIGWIIQSSPVVRDDQTHIFTSQTNKKVGGIFVKHFSFLCQSFSEIGSCNLIARSK